MIWEFAALTLTMHQASAPLFRQGLTSLAAILAKVADQSAARSVAPATLLADRLVADMFPLVRQVQLSCDFAKNTMARLAGREPPRFEDVEGTLPELQERIARTLAFVDAVPAAAVDGSEGRTITLAVAGNSLTFTGQDYLLHFALPNFFFHVTTAYAILRKNGFEIGKRDFIGPIPGLA